MTKSKRKNKSRLDLVKSTAKNISSKPKRKIEVVTFVDPTLRTSASTTNNRKHNSDRENENSNKNDILTLNSASSDVYKLAVTGFTRKMQKQHQSDYIASLGGRRKAASKVPLPIMLGIRKAAVKRDRRERRAAKVADLVVGSKQINKNLKRHSKSRSNKDSLAPIRKTSFKDGVMQFRTK